MSKDKLTLVEPHVLLRLDFLKLYADYKSFIKNVAHDLTSPLNYLENSIQILNLQLGDIKDEDLKETVRVITNSTSHLRKDASILTQEAKSNLINLGEDKLLCDLLNSCLEILDLKKNHIALDGDVNTPLNIDFIITQYVLSYYLHLIQSDDNVYLNSIIIKQIDHKLEIKCYCELAFNYPISNLKQRINSKEKYKVLKATKAYLKVNTIVEDKPIACITIHLTPLL